MTEQHTGRPPEFHTPALPFRDCACGGRVRVAGVEVATRTRRKPRVWFRCTGCGTRWVEQPDDQDDPDTAPTTDERTEE